MKPYYYVFFSALVHTSSAWAHPVSFKDGIGVMPEYTPGRQELELNYSLTSESAVGVIAIDADIEDEDTNYVLPRFNYRLFRQNELESQTNVYASFGAGTARRNDETDGAALLMLQADYETRRFYTLLLGEAIESTGNADSTRVRYRIGVAPYLTDFDGLHTWLILQSEYYPEMDEDWAITPLIRLFYSNYLIEVGSSTEGDLFAAGIFHF